MKNGSDGLMGGGGRGEMEGGAMGGEGKKKKIDFSSAI